MAAPTKTFINQYAGTFDGDSFTVGSNFYDPITVQDTADGPADDLTVLGDISGDTFSATAASGGTFNDLIYIDKTADGSGTIHNVQGQYFLLTNNFYDPGTVLQTTAGTYPICFATGTLIRTARGDVPVEGLMAGDLAVAASGEHRPITWIGHRDLSGNGQALPHNQRPVRVRAGAFGFGLPLRDLYLSPGHPLLVGACADNTGGSLVPVMCLINGTTIQRMPMSKVTYWHVELDQHDILLAEGLPAESYLDWGDRPFFDEASDHALHNPDFVVPGLEKRCRPVAVDGPIVEAERARLDAVFSNLLAAHCGWDEVGSWLNG